MLKDLEEGRLPTIPNIPSYNLQEWELLRLCWEQTPFKDKVQFYTQEQPDCGFSWVLQENVGDFGFRLHRSMMTDVRITDRNDTGLLGLSLINPKDTRVILTEGVSDFFTMKLYCPDMNVLGVTNLGGSINSRAIVLNLFDRILYCRDNDSAGLDGAMKWKQFLESYGKKVKIWSPSSDCKDVTEMFIKNIKLSKNSKL